MRAGQLLEQSLALHRELHDRSGTAYCLNLLSHGQMMLGDAAAAHRSLAESLTIFRALGDRRGMGYALYLWLSKFFSPASILTSNRFSAGGIGQLHFA